MVVLAERVADTKFAFKELKPASCSVNNVVGIEKFSKRLTTKNTHGVGAVDTGVFAAFFVIRTSDQSRDVGGHSSSGIKAPHTLAVIEDVCDGCWGVGDDFPMRWCSHSEGIGRLQIWLIKAGKHALGIGGLELGVEVHLVVHGVNESMQAFASVGVHAIAFDGEDVVVS